MDATDTDKLQQAIDDAYRDGPDDTELAVRRAMRQKHAARVMEQETKAWIQCTDT